MINHLSDKEEEKRLRNLIDSGFIKGSHLTNVLVKINAVKFRLMQHEVIIKYDFGECEIQ